MDFSPSLTTSTLNLLGIYLPILGSAVFFIYSLYRDRLLRRKEYADKIRISAGIVVAKLERWKMLSLRFFEDIEPLLTNTDKLLEEDKDFNRARYDLWSGLEEKKALSSQRIVDEQIEMAYIDLYGYDPAIGDLFLNATNMLKKIDKYIYKDLRVLTQENIFVKEEKYNKDNELILGELGGDLRMTCGILEEKCEIYMNKIIEPFRKELLNLINARDGQIVDRSIKISLSKMNFEDIIGQKCRNNKKTAIIESREE